MGEIVVFRRVGGVPVLLSGTLDGERAPCLVYVPENVPIGARGNWWDGCRNGAVWKALPATPGSPAPEMACGNTTRDLRTGRRWARRPAGGKQARGTARAWPASSSPGRPRPSPHRPPPPRGHKGRPPSRRNLVSPRRADKYAGGSDLHEHPDADR